MNSSLGTYPVPLGTRKGQCVHSPSRRRFLRGSSALAVVSLAGCARRKPTWKNGAYRKPVESRVAILKAASYDRDLTSVILDGIKCFRLDLLGKRVLLYIRT
jgi:hypothetical protein